MAMMSARGTMTSSAEVPRRAQHVGDQRAFLAGRAREAGLRSPLGSRARLLHPNPRSPPANAVLGATPARPRAQDAAYAVQEGCRFAPFKSVLFLKKKNQKNFWTFARVLGRTIEANNQKFFASFFSKKKGFLPHRRFQGLGTPNRCKMRALPPFPSGAPDPRHGGHDRAGAGHRAPRGAPCVVGGGAAQGGGFALHGAEGEDDVAAEEAAPWDWPWARRSARSWGLRRLRVAGVEGFHVAVGGEHTRSRRRRRPVRRGRRAASALRTTRLHRGSTTTTVGFRSQA